jgi:hypothetical protein
VEVLRDHFSRAAWYDVYDFLELLLEALPAARSEALRNGLNSALEGEQAGYRVVGNRVVDIVAPAELDEVDAARGSTLEGARAHIDTALKLLSDRRQPDYRNSIKESISAIEAVARVLTRDENATLGAALRPLQERLGLHGALKSALSSLYGYTSDEPGLRHAMTGAANVSASDARFMLVICSAFVNYLVAKSAEAAKPP